MDTRQQRAFEGLRRLYPELNFGGWPECSGDLPFYARIHSLITPESVVLDVGCGTGFHRKLSEGFMADLQNIRGKVSKVIGLDVDPNAAANEGIDEFRLIASDRWAVESDSIDLCYAQWVLEHLSDPDQFFAEAARVIKVGGYLCFRTPNRWHYSSIGASLVPDRWHYALRRMLGHPHEAEDVFPTLFRCNSTGRCRRFLVKHGFEGVVRTKGGVSQLTGLGSVAGRMGKWIEGCMPPPMKTEIQGFARKVF